MEIRASFLPLSAVVLLSTVALFSTGGAVTLENVVYPGPNRTDELFNDEFSFSAAVRFMDSAALSWQKEKGCFACHTDYPYLLARPAISHKVPAHTEIRPILEQRVDTHGRRSPDLTETANW